MATAIRMIGHEDRLSLVDHLEELRTRLIVSVAVLAVAFGICLWQNHALLHIMNKPLQTETKKQVANGDGTVGQANVAQQGIVKTAETMQGLVGLLARPGSGISPSIRKQLPPLASKLKGDVAKLPRSAVGIDPVTTGIAEPFTTTITVTLYFALILSLPVILFELYGFILPALAPHERRVAMPLLGAVPFLFAAGVGFGYFVVLPAAVRFFANFNSSEFNVLVQASPLYSFEATILLAMGLVFQVPVVVLGATRLGLVTPRQLRRGRPFAFAGCAAVAAFLPGDALTLLLETVPLYLLYELSILIAALVGRANRVRPEQGSAATAGVGYPSGGAAPQPPEHPAEPTVQDLIDHIDPNLSGS
ncbi:MAG TPA: twin-arginine translocase subunit TatC [Solirubrobacteraceae bacterium]|nr:twin-arginine translocase subunit TatC [Solirubrobacteraceae bacterium]